LNIFWVIRVTAPVPEYSYAPLMSGTFEDLRAWECAMSLAVDIYDLTSGFPKQELYGLVSQLRRAAVSIPSNIAEGKGRSSDRDFCHFLDQSRGSVNELRTQLMLAQRIGYLNKTQCQQFLEKTSEVGRLVNGLIKSIRPNPVNVH
jgi:four helix bundle protein